jgi:hypothetical protein
MFYPLKKCSLVLLFFVTLEGQKLLSRQKYLSSDKVRLRNCSLMTPKNVDRDSAVSIATRYGLDGPGIEFRWGARFSEHVQTGPEGPPSLLYNEY